MPLVLQTRGLGSTPPPPPVSLHQYFLQGLLRHTCRPPTLNFDSAGDGWAQESAFPSGSRIRQLQWVGAPITMVSVVGTSC